MATTALLVRDVERELITECKVRAARLGITLKRFVMLALEEACEQPEPTTKKK